MEFIDIILSGNLEKAKEYLEKNPEHNIHTGNEEAFCLSCGYGHIEIAKWLYGLDGKIDIHAYNAAFRESCQQGHIEIAKWLYGLDGKIDIHAYDDAAFCESCEYGDMEIAKWLYVLNGKINIHAYNDEAFHLSCRNDHIEIAKWLYELDKQHYDEFLVNSDDCIYDKIKEWIYEERLKNDKLSIDPNEIIEI